MSSVLMKIQAQVRKCVHVIQSFFNEDVDVDMCDENLIRIAGTGRFSGMIGQRLVHGKLSTIAIEEKREVFVFNPLHEEPCRSCEHLRFCGSYARMVFPMISKGAVLGVVSVTAVNPVQGRDMVARKDRLILFIHAIRDLVILAARENEEGRRRDHQRKLQENLVDAIRDGVMILDDGNGILSINRRGESILGCTMAQIRQLMGERRFSLTRVGGGGEEVEFLLRIRRSKIRLGGRLHEIGGGEAGEAARLFVFADMRTMQENLLPAGSMVSCSFDSIIGKSPAFTEAVKACRAASFHSTPALLSGEVAVGKEVFARAIHNESVYRSNRFIRVAHGSELQALIDREAFDRERSNSNDFVFQAERLAGNTVYVDEVGDFTLEDQCVVLALIQKARQLNTRVLCSTSKDLEPLVESGKFHPELFYSLEVHAIPIPPLRDRGDDITLFVNHYLKAANRQMHRNVLLSKAVHALFMAHPWRGNIREVENTIAFLVEHAEADNKEITRKLLPAALVKKFAGREKKDYNLEKAEKQRIVQALNDPTLGGSRAKVATALGISNATLYRKLKQYGIRQKTKYD